MKGKLHFSLLVFLSLFVLSCSKKEWDNYYGRPEGLGQPIYQQLEHRGNFKHLLALLDKAGYKDILGQQGWWTFFAPTDNAFDLFYQANNLSDETIDDSLASAIVKYNLLFNSYRKDQLSIYQQGGTADVIPGQAFKRRTAYYDWVKGEGRRLIVQTNRNASYTRTSSISSAGVEVSRYVDGDNNFKNIPYFTDDYLNMNGLSVVDYLSFFPEAKFNNFSVVDANVVEKDIPAENGTIHVIDKVIKPLPSLDQYLSSHSQYSEYKKLLDSVAFYTSNAYMTGRNKVVNDNSDSVYVKAYSGQLAFSPNNENYQEAGTTSFFATMSQSRNYTMLVPTNEALTQYRKKLLVNYQNSFGKAPATLLIDFINSTMWAQEMWPSQFNVKTNFLEETPSVTISEVSDKQLLSNGMLYGLSRAHESNLFRTIYGIPYLNPRFSMTLMAYSYAAANIRSVITQPNVSFVSFITPDDVLTAAGWRYNEGSAGTSTTPWGFKSATSTSYSHSANYRDIIMRIMRTGLALSPNAQFDNLSGKGMIETLNGEYIKFDNDRIQTSGTLDDNNRWIKITALQDQPVNGRAYIVDGLLTYSEKNVGYHLENLAVSLPESYSSYVWLVQNSGIYNSTTGAIAGVNLGADYNYTIFAPTNAAISEAVKAGLLPGNKTTGALPSSKPTNQIDLDNIRKFILYHILNGASVVPDGRKSDNYLTLLQTEAGDNTFIEVTNLPGNIVITDRSGHQASTILSTSNQLSSRTVIHSINSYLNYNR